MRLKTRAVALVISTIGAVVGTVIALAAEQEGHTTFRNIAMLAAIGNAMMFFYVFTRR